MAEALILEEFKEGQVIYKEGDLGENFYLIHEGTVAISKGTRECQQLVERLAAKACFGERALVKTDMR